MQLNEIGSRHGSNTHHVTSCMHDHSHINKVGKVGAAPSGVSVQSAMAAESQADAQFSLAEWLDKTLNGGRRLWGRIWGDADGINVAGGAAETTRGSGSEGGAEQIAAILPQEDSGSGQQVLHTAQIAAAATAVRQPQEIHSTHHFSPGKKPGERQGNLRRMRAKLESMAEQLAGRSSRKPVSARTGKLSQVRQERPKEELPRQGKPSRDELVLNCVQSDDSYLLDSYDRKGEYRRISAGK